MRALPHSELVIAAAMVYLKTVGKLREAEIRMALQQLVGESIAEEILFGAERRIEKATRDGERRGERRGELKGERKLLKQLVAQRFGAQPQDAIACIEAASAEHLEAMALRVLTAATLDDVLRGTPTNSR